MMVHDVASGRVAEVEHASSVGLDVKTALVHLPSLSSYSGPRTPGHKGNYLITKSWDQA